MVSLASRKLFFFDRRQKSNVSNVSEGFWITVRFSANRKVSGSASRNDLSLHKWKFSFSKRQYLRRVAQSLPHGSVSCFYGSVKIFSGNLLWRNILLLFAKSKKVFKFKI